MTIVIAGVSGSLGRHLAQKFFASGEDVIGISRQNPFVEGIRHISHDLREPLTVALPKDSIVINSAAITKDGSDPKILEGNLAIANSCLEIGGLGHILVSSSSVYDLRKPTVKAAVSEATGDYPFLNTYSKSKFESETKYLESGVVSIILRPHALRGEGDQTLLPRLKKVMRNGHLWLPNGGLAHHEFTSFDNFSRAVELSVQKIRTDWHSQVALNVSDGKATSIAQAINAALEPESATIHSIPIALAQAAGLLNELIAQPGAEPRLSRYAVCQLAFERTYDLSATKSFLGYLAG